MTFDDDHVYLHLHGGPVHIMLTRLGLEWPPPERIFIAKGVREATDNDPADQVMVRFRMSEISDVERSGMTHVCRGAEYFYTEELPWK